MKRQGKVRSRCMKNQQLWNIFQTQLRATERCVERNPDNQYDLVKYWSAEIFGSQLLGCLSELNDLGRSNRDSNPPPQPLSWGTRPCGLGGKGKADEPARRIAYTPLQSGYKKGGRSENITFIEGNKGRPRNCCSRFKVCKNKEQSQVVGVWPLWTSSP